MKLSPDRDEFLRLAATHNIIPVTADLPADLDTPVSVYCKIVGDRPGFMLESAETSKNFGRYSFIGADPLITLTATARHTDVRRRGKRSTIAGPPLAALQRILGGHTFPGLPGLPPFCGGAVGYLAYEAAATWERIRGLAVPDDMILGEYLICQTIIALDHLTHTARLIHLAPVDSPAAAPAAYETAAESLAALALRLRQPAVLPQTGAPEGGREEVADGRDDYIAAVNQAKEHIAAGDIFQAVLSRPFRRPLTTEPFHLYRRLRHLNPSPYMFYLNFGSRQLVGASPEMLVKLRDGQVYTCPIAGTRPRGRDAAEDARLAADLLADDKERAEHAMLVDLGRNDLGRISLPGTVAVSRLMEVENYSHVMHIVSEVTGTLDPRYTPTDVLAACFPAGTLSGAPKIRAMEIIAGLESAPRGPYGGAVGYFDFRGNIDTCITIRTLIIDGGQVVIQTGAGIVADSVPAVEYQEILHKAGALFQVMGGAQP
ncbi:anthranilate synthase component I family protein [Anaeroselena agilis]|uniref:Anthranilate synthase component I family protein n=1 Tax=Anaeroselena agilis TaxID=3063788 RepID=A0ABU3P1F9_9FIRM|nr:anthranilate synthase component I family protein [Selenomonadales bacterium 4137-cl]